MSKGKRSLSEFIKEARKKAYFMRRHHGSGDNKTSAAAPAYVSEKGIQSEEGGEMGARQAKELTFEEISQACKEAAQAAFEAREWINGHVSWGNFSCTQVVRWEDERGKAGVNVLFQGASQNQEELREFILSSIGKTLEGLPDNFDVWFEW